MEIVCNKVNNNLVVSVAGELDHHNTEYARDKIDAEFQHSHTLNIIFDFSNINFMDSSGIGLIMGRYKKVSLLGGQVVLTNVSPQLDRIFNISGLYKIMKKISNIEEALEIL